MLNLDKEQTSFKMLPTDTYDTYRPNKINSLENIRLAQEHLTLQKVKMSPPHFASKCKHKWTEYVSQKL